VEVERDGIVGSPDGYDPGGRLYAQLVEELNNSPVYVDADPMGEGWEMKFTWKSITSSPPDAIWAWRVQFMGYATLTGSHTTNLLALYGCGDWRPPQPRLVGLRFRWTDQELEENWRMLTSAREQMLREGAGT
jgi:hypothetical protein